MLHPSYLPYLGRLKKPSGYRCNNLVIHPNRGLYGDANRLGCGKWLWDSGRLLFLDNPGRIRFRFDQLSEGIFFNAAAPRSFPNEREQCLFNLEDGRQLRLFTPPVDYELQPQKLPSTRSRFEVVIAKYREDVTWTAAITNHVMIYSKDFNDKGRYVLLDNWGREGGTYFHHILTKYDDLAERTLFLQGDPFPHPLLAFEQYAHDLAPFTSAPVHVQSIDWEVPWSTPGQRLTKEVMQSFLKMIECRSDVESFAWSQGAQFAVSRSQILRRPRSYYQSMFELTQRPRVQLAGRQFDNHHVAWLFELFWRNIFTD